MKVSRRRFFPIAAIATALPQACAIAWAQTYPARPVKLIVGYPPGGATDIAARLIGQWLSEHLGQPFVVENRSGASGNIATRAVVTAASDGYTLLLVNAGNVINTALYAGLDFAFSKDITPVAGIIRVPLVMLVNTSASIGDVSEFVTYAKANPGKVNMASAGTGTPQHLAGELFKMMTGVDLVHVPYRGSAPALSDLLSGQVQVAFDTTAASIEFVRSGRLRALAVTTRTMSQVLPEVRPLSDVVPGYDASGWYGVGSPRKTPVEIVGQLNNEVNKALADPQIRAKFAGLGGEVFPNSPSEFGRFISAETEKWASVIKFAGVTAE